MKWHALAPAVTDCPVATSMSVFTEGRSSGATTAEPVRVGAVFSWIGPYAAAAQAAVAEFAEGDN